MASVIRSDVEGVAGEDGTAALGDAFQQVAQGLLRMQDALRLQEQQTERRIQEALRLQEQRAASAMRQMQQQLLQERDEAIGALRRSLDERLQRLEERVDALVEERGGSERQQQSGEQGASERLEKLEAAVQRALSTVFPRVEDLVVKLEQPSPPGPPLALPYPASSARAATAPGGAAAGAREAPVADDEESIKRRVRLRVTEAKARNASLSRWHPYLYISPEENLFRAVVRGQLGDVRHLLNVGANVNFINSLDRSCLMVAVIYNHMDIVALLVDKGADVNAINCQGRSALHFAAAHGNSRVMSLLLDAGAEVDARAEDGETPLHCAVEGADVKACVRMLLSAGARKDVKGWSGHWENKSPFDLAKSDAIRNLLRI